MNRSRRGVSMVEVMVASVLMALLAFPLLELLQGGMRITRSTIDEVVGANLAAELADQLDTVPVATIEGICPGAACTLSSDDGTLVEDQPMGAAGRFRFRLSPLPPGYDRSVSFRRIRAGVHLAEVRVNWMVANVRQRDILIKRLLVDEVPIVP